jgi:3-dehydroquinate synthase
MPSFFLSEGETTIIIHRSSLDHLNFYLPPFSQSYTQAVLICTPQVFNLYGEKVLRQLKKINLKATSIFIPEGEKAKCIHCATYCWEQMAREKIDRHSVVIGLGGGATTDLSGFLASSYMRGIDSIYLPTTLLGMVDAAIGGKTAINCANFKNLVGSFHSPKLIVIDPCCLKTLPFRELCAGFAEIIKYAIIKDSELFEELEEKIEFLRKLDLVLFEELIYRSCKIKSEIICLDPQDTKDIRAILNYGHTFAHAIETLTNYEDYLHGEAVSIGMSCAAHLSYRMNQVDASFVNRQDRLCIKAGLPIEFPSHHCSVDRMIDIMKRDKKSINGKISLILPEKIGKVFKFSNTDPELIKQTLITKDRYSFERTRSASFFN